MRNNQVLNDNVHAFMPHPFAEVPHAKTGPLQGLTLAVKDIFDVAGYVTGCGSPEKWQEGRVADKTASSVQKLLDAGARLVGKTTTEELAFSLNGDNVHYPQPINSAAPQRITGGSSSGSAASIAASLVDIATGSDTGGSVRAPASYCGLIGLRTTHGRIALDQTMPLAESFDTFGWFTRTIDQYRQVGNVMLDGYEPDYRPKRVILAQDCLSFLTGPDEARALEGGIEHVSALALQEEVSLANGEMESWYWTFRKCQGYEAWQTHGDWIKTVKPGLGPGVKQRFDYASKIGVEDYQDGLAEQAAITRHVEEVLGHDGLLIIPTVPGPAPLRSVNACGLEDYRVRALMLLCVSSLTGLPQLTLPMAHVGGAPLGLSLLGPRGIDRQLTHLGLDLLTSFKNRI